MAEIVEKRGTKQNPYGKHRYGEYFREHCSKTTCDKCKEIFAFVDTYLGETTKVYYCGHLHKYGALHEVIKFAREQENGERKRGCCFCKHFHDNISKGRCFKCLMTEDLCNFEIRQDL